MSGADLYLDLMKRTLLNTIYQDPNVGPWQPPGYDEALRLEGRDWPRDAHTMIGVHRLDNLQACVEDVIQQGVPGDLVEAGVWRGGASIFMRAVLAAHGVTDRIVWAADSFEGLPPPEPDIYPADAGDQHHEQSEILAVSLEEVRAHFDRYGLLDDQVRFLEGWFKDTLPDAPIAEIAVLRLDGDMYQSTMETLESLYPRLSPGGYALVDDYGAIDGCREAIDDYRATHGIDADLQTVDWTGVFWQRPTAGQD